MSLLFSGRNLGQAVKNVQRLRTILGVLGRHGFSDIVVRMNLGKYLPKRFTTSEEADRTTQERLRLAFEELGPTFVKLGQLLSTRPDLLPEVFIEEFTRLQDNVATLPYEVVKGVIEKEFGKPIEEIFTEFSQSPLASASIAQVHEAVLKNGEKVVVKVQRPGIDRIINTDISLLGLMAKLLERYVPETRIVSPSIIVDEFFRTLSYELDFQVEANNTLKVRENMASIPDIVVPEVYKEYSSRRVLTLEKIEGLRVNDVAALDRAGIDRKQVVELGARAFFKSVFIDGVFHGDLHGGNLFVLPGNRLGIIDFGIVGRLSQKSRDQLANMMMSLLTEDYEHLCYQYADLGAADASVDFANFNREVQNALSPYMGLTLSEVNLGKVLIEATKIATKYNIRVPGDWMLVFKAILTIEGMGRTLDPDFDLLALGQDLVKDLVKNQYSVQRFSKELLWIAKDTASLLQTLPRQIRWMFRKFNSNDFAFEVKIQELSEIREQMNRDSQRRSLSMLVASFLISACIALDFPYVGDFFGVPGISAGLFALAIGLLIRMIFI